MHIARLALPLAAFAVLVFAGPASAVIKKLTPLKEVLEGEEFIFVAKVDKVDPEKPSVIFTFGENLKGKAPFERLAVNLTGDSFAKKDDHTKVMLERLAPERKLVLFVSKQGPGYSCFGFMEGTWFQLKGTKDGDAVRWAFLHCEPYFRRTFKGTTEELTTVLTECLAGKRKPPEPDEKEPAGYGPVVEKKSSVPLPQTNSPTLFGVIPSFVLIGPLAILAALFPGVFAPLMVYLKRWRALLIIASINSTLALAYWGVREFRILPETMFLSPQAVGCYILLVTAAGVVWAGWRYRVLAIEEPELTGPPSSREVLITGAFALVLGVFVVGTAWFAGWGEVIYPAGLRNGRDYSGIGKEFTAVTVGLLASTLYAGYRLLIRNVYEADFAREEKADPDAWYSQAVGSEPLITYPRMSLSGEAVGLAAIFLFGLTVMLVTWPRTGGTATLAAELGDAGAGDVAVSPKLDTAGIWFETTNLHEVMSAVVVTPDRVLFGGGKSTSFHSKGAVICVDRATGKELWRFDNEDDLAPVFATPTVSDEQVYVGEGLHTDADRRMFRLDAKTGKPSWVNPVTTKSHTEGSARVVNGKVYFSAGDDGLYCVTAAEGNPIWHYKGVEQKLHIDTPPSVANGRVFGGSGYSTLALFALNADTGVEIWRKPVTLRSFGSPLVLGDKVVYGLGTGNLSDDLSTEPETGVPPEKTPAGMVMCVEAATGQEVWKYDLPKSVHTNLAADARSIYAASRDGYLYALDRSSGKLRWKVSLGSSFTAGPTVSTYARGAVSLAVYAVTNEGRVACIDPVGGKLFWVRDLREITKQDVQVLSTPVVVPVGEDGARRQLYVGAMVTNRNTGAKSAAVFRFEDVIE